MKLVLVLLLAGVLLAGCKTETAITRVDEDHFVVKDKGGAIVGETGGNPEKGILETCPAVGRYIVGWKKVADSKNGNSIVVTCGPLVPEAKR